MRDTYTSAVHYLVFKQPLNTQKKLSYFKDGTKAGNMGHSLLNPDLEQKIIIQGLPHLVLKDKHPNHGV